MAEEKFDPAAHLTKIKGQDYLETKWRIAWLRSEHPDATIESEVLKWFGDANNPGVLYRSVVTLSTGGSATGHGSETAKDFGDFIEKAETKAVGRALAMLGYGTQFAVDLDEGDRIVDAPVNRQNGAGARQQDQRTPNTNQGGSAPQRPRQQQQEPDVQGVRNMDSPPSDAQRRKFDVMVSKLRLNPHMVAQQVSGYPLENLNKFGYSKCIDRMTEIEKGDVEVPPGWWATDEDAAAPPPATERGQEPVDDEDPKERAMDFILRAQSPESLDRIYESLKKVGLQDDDDLLGAMAKREEHLLAAENGG